MKSSSSIANAEEHPDASRFRQKFQRSLKVCMQRGFAAEECFGIVWEETCEQYDLPDAAAQRLYAEMLTWAKQWVRS